MNKLFEEFTLISPERQIEEFLTNNTNTLKIIETMKPHLTEHFPTNKFSLEISDDLKWTVKQNYY